jgi:hypothetical protein
LFSSTNNVGARTGMFDGVKIAEGSKNGGGAVGVEGGVGVGAIGVEGGVGVIGAGGEGGGSGISKISTTSESPLELRPPPKNILFVDDVDAR